MSGIQRAFADDVIGTYFEMGNSALERGQYAIAQKMFKAIFQEPSAKAQKDKIMLSLLVKSAQAHEGLKQLYKAKLLYIRALALIKRQGVKGDMQCVDILIILSKINASQALYKQAMEFVSEAMRTYETCPDKDAVSLVRNLRQLEQIFESKGRMPEQTKIKDLLAKVRSDALDSLGALPIGTQIGVSALAQAAYVS